MAYLKKFQRKCGFGGCERASTCEVFGARNDFHGDYCLTHGEDRVEMLNKLEAENRERARKGP